jgi:hypothetical protein
VKNRIRCELVKLHTVNKEKPMKELVGRKRKTTEEESEEHYPITTRGLRDPLNTGKLDEILGGDEAIYPGFLHLLRRDGRANKLGGRGSSWPWCSWRLSASRASIAPRSGAMHEQKEEQRLAMEAAEGTSW